MNIIEAMRALLKDGWGMGEYVFPPGERRVTVTAAQVGMFAFIEAFDALEPTQEDWANAPEWAQWYTADIHGYLYWHQREPVFGSVSWVQTGFREKCGYSKLPIGIDSRLCKWKRPEV